MVKNHNENQNKAEAKTKAKTEARTKARAKTKAEAMSKRDAAEKKLTGTTKRALGDDVIAIFAYPAMSFMAEALDRVSDASSPDVAAGRRRRGRRAGHPTVALLATASAARVAGSRPRVLSALAADDTRLWQRARRAYAQVNGVDLPAYPPTKNELDYFYSRFFGDEKTGRATFEALSAAFTTAAVRQARHLGNLLPGQAPDWAHYDPTHTVFGDGTIVKPYSDVQVRTLPDGSRIALGSRAGDVSRARPQSAVRTFADNKGLEGINFVSLQTRTDRGRVVLAVASTLRSELVPALDLCDRVAAEAGDGFQTLVYDRLITGWSVRYLMGAHGVQVQGKIAAPGSKEGPDEDDATRFDTSAIPTPGQRASRLQLPERVNALAANQGLDVDDLTQPLLRRAVLQNLFDHDRLPPVGTTLYPTTNGYDTVHGYCFTTTATHTDATGQDCVHDLVIDDGALYTYELDQDRGQLVKTHLLRCTTATRHTTAAGSYGVRQSYQVPCPHGAFTYTRTWEPEATRFAPEDTNRPNAADPIGWRLHPIPRADQEKFAAIGRDRNDSESYQAWFKLSLPGLHRERAASIGHVSQDLDFLCFAILANARTWANRV